MSVDIGGLGDFIIDKESLENCVVDENLELLGLTSADELACHKISLMETILGEKYKFALSRMPETTEYILVEKGGMESLNSSFTLEELDGLIAAVVSLDDTTRRLHLTRDSGTGRLGIVEASIIGGYAGNEQIITEGEHPYVPDVKGTKNRERLKEIILFMNSLHGQEQENKTAED